MSELPSGTVSLLFTDIESSTQLQHRLGERYQDVVAEHRRLLEQAFPEGDDVASLEPLDAVRRPQRWIAVENEQPPFLGILEVVRRRLTTVSRRRVCARRSRLQKPRPRRR